MEVNRLVEEVQPAPCIEQGCRNIVSPSAVREGQQRCPMHEYMLEREQARDAIRDTLGQCSTVDEIEDFMYKYAIPLLQERQQ